MPGFGAVVQELIVRLRYEATGQGALNETATGLSKVEQHAGAAGVRLTGLSGITKSVGGAMEHAAGQIGGLVSNMGFLAGGAGLLSLGAALTSSVDKIEAFGAGLEKVQTLTGESAVATGALILEFQKYGLGIDKVTQVVGFTEKTLGKLNETTAKGAAATKSAALITLEDQKLRLQAAGASTKRVDALIKEQKAQDKLAASQQQAGASTTKLEALDAQFGLRLVDSQGKVVSFSETLSQLATFYDSNASASTKAYVASQIFGRGYTTMIPILNEGSAGLRRAAKDAESLGLSSQDTVKQIIAFHDEAHALDNQVNLLQLSIGTALLPTLIDAAKALTGFISDNRTGIVSAFKGGVQAAEDLAGALGQIFSVLKSGWDAVPGPLRNLLITGFVANKASSWLFGGSLLQGGRSLLSSLVGATPLAKVPGVGALAGAGVPHVWVDNMPAGGILGGVGPTIETVATGGVTAFLSSAAGLAAIAAVGVAILGADALLTQNNRGPAGGPPTPDNKNTYSPSQSGLQIQTRNPRFINQQRAFYDEATGNGPIDQQRQHYLDANLGLNRSFVNDQKAHHNEEMNGLGAIVTATDANRTVLDALHQDLQTQLTTLRTSKDPSAQAAAATALVTDILKGAGGFKSNTNALSLLRGIRATATDPALIAALDGAIARIEKHLPGEKFIATQEATADKIVHSNLTSAQKIEKLGPLMRSLDGHSQAGMAHIAAEIAALKLTVTVNVNATAQRNPTTFTSFGQGGKNQTTRRAGGGPVGGGVYTVGEEGSETLLLAPGSAGYVVPHGRANGGFVGSEMPWDTLARLIMGDNPSEAPWQRMGWHSREDWLASNRGRDMSPTQFYSPGRGGNPMQIYVHATTTDRSNVISRTKAQRWSTVRSMAQ